MVVLFQEVTRMDFLAGSMVDVNFFFFTVLIAGYFVDHGGSPRRACSV